MANYLVIDADSHVEEPEEAWNYLQEKYRERRPVPIAVPSRPILAKLNAFWWIDGVVYPKISGSNHTVYGTPPVSYHATHKKYSIGSQTLHSPGERLKDMDARRAIKERGDISEIQKQKSWARTPRGFSVYDFDEQL